MCVIDAGRRLLVDACGMDAAEYDRHIERLAERSVLDQSGEMRFLVTMARRA